jgi:ribosome maturation factor RimP
MSISEDNQIKILIDGDSGVNVDDCVFVSRAIEHNLNREEVDFALEVASAGATSPIVNKRQYNKNIGRNLEIKTTSDKIEGILKEISEEGVLLEWKVREPKLVGKGKVTVKKEAMIAYSDIVEAKVLIKF